MKKFIHTHKILSIMVVLLLLPCLIGAFFYAKSLYDNYQAKQKLERTLAYNGYSNVVERSPFHKEASGLMNSMTWYQFTFATKETLEESYKYQKALKKPYKHLTLKNCPIVYWVILTPPTPKTKRWTTLIYLDTNTGPRGVWKSRYINNLRATSYKDLKMKEQDSKPTW
ncbi:hypothetical protein [Lacticaseibacillus paracasei]|uniref:hypothetical protein n=2 Tax=Lacticaseibacillus paracasei TaxID=1597 RepID=UPI0027394D4B|nr:hypothetical protein [Lacticaseibacillus paracasei]